MQKKTVMNTECQTITDFDPHYEVFYIVRKSKLARIKLNVWICLQQMGRSYVC